jgi:hypothetical protein
MSRIFPYALAVGIVVLVGASISHSAAAAEKESPRALVQAVFYEGEGASQNTLCTVKLAVPAIGEPEITTTIDFRHEEYGCDNDEADSVKLFGLTPGSEVFVADKDDCTGANALIHIESVTDDTPIVVHDWDGGSTDPRYTIKHNTRRGTEKKGDIGMRLNGKVSCGWITVKAPH